jgi:NAD+ diphosphatase
VRGGEWSGAYGGGWLDRAADRRGDPEWVAARLAGPGAVVLPLWRDHCLVTADRVPVRVPAGAAGELVAAAGSAVLLGLDGGTAVFAVDLSALPEEAALALAGASAAVDVRALVGGLTAAGAAVQAYARGLLHWHRERRFCGGCGSPTEVRDGGHSRFCAGCERFAFPAIAPAVIMLVAAPDGPARCLLARHRGGGPDSWSLLAGFVEVGESLEDAVRRELAEEAGVRVVDVAYQGSQAWPFPAGLMVGFRATAASMDVQVDGVELLEARWFTRDELRARADAGRLPGRVDSIDRHLLGRWLDLGGDQGEPSGRPAPPEG